MHHRERSSRQKIKRLCTTFSDSSDRNENLVCLIVKGLCKYYSAHSLHFQTCVHVWTCGRTHHHQQRKRNQTENDQKEKLRFTCRCSVFPCEVYSSDHENISFVFQAPGLALDITRFVLTASNLQLQVEKKNKHPVVRITSNVLLVHFGSLLQRKTQKCAWVFSMSMSEVRQDTTNKAKPTDFVICSCCIPCRGGRNLNSASIEFFHNKSQSMQGRSLWLSRYTFFKHETLILLQKHWIFSCSI